ncbi:S-adenosyl-L-methionine-dependent methyltransferase [Mycena venus]|uniref:S-adenosyl-L-methionine-dependent methyltransferase n=1 Tax=Mycena venus TaxID=2733690 RepID=A0A8H6Z2W0_9AGAR|nr:S-adenosyl-L-methionine-dependent methyltransferase [Mycena venus]
MNYLPPGAVSRKYIGNEMATFADSSYDSGSYAASRPTYPRLLYDVVLRFHKEGQATEDLNRWNRALDLGCGTGQATVQLLANDDHPGFQTVAAVDPSPNMIQVAKDSVPETLKSQVEFRQSNAEDLSFIENGTVDLITAGTRLQIVADWMQFQTKCISAMRALVRLESSVAGTAPGFEARRDTRMSGSHSTPELTPLLTAYSQGTDPATSLGPHWESGRKILDNHFLDVVPPASGWTDLRRVFYTGTHYPALPEPPHEDVIIKKSMTWGGGFAGYLSTYSALHRYQDAFPADRERADGGYCDAVSAVVDGECWKP